MISSTFPSTSSRRGLVVLACLGGLLLSGCGPDGGGSSKDSGSAPSSAPSSGPSSEAAPTEPAETDSDTSASDDPCDIVSDEVVSEVLGVDIERREPHTGPHNKGGSCIKGTARNNDLSKVSYVSAAIFPGLGGRFVDQAGAEGAKSVEGLGDRAVFLANAGALFIVDGDDGFQVQVVNGGKPGGLDDSILVAEDMLARNG